MIYVPDNKQGRSQEFKFGGAGAHGERGTRAYNGGLGAEPPAGSRGRAPGQEVRGRSPPEAESLLAFQRPMTAAKFIPLTVCDNFSLSGCL